MTMEKYQRLKGKYDEITNQISNLYQTQAEIRKRMEEECPHQHLERMEPDAYLVGIGVEDDVVRFKCKDCYRYFSEEEVKQLNHTSQQ